MTRLVTPFVPSVEIYQTFAQATATQLQELSAFIFGSSASVFRYDYADEKPMGALGTYYRRDDADSAAWQAYSFPNRPVGVTIDQDFSRVHIDSAYLQYWSETPGSFTRTAVNEITHASLSFAANGTSYPTSAAFGDRGVKAGDRILINGELADTTPFTLATYVQAVRGIPTGASVGAVEASDDNAIVSAGSDSITAGIDNITDAVGVVDSSLYNGLESGHQDETYLVEVITPSTGGDPTTARLRVTSASGTDNIALLEPAAYGLPTAIGGRGLTVTLTSGTTDDLYEGDNWTISVVQAYAIPVLTQGGTYNATDQKDRRYIVEVVSGADMTDSPVIRVTTAAGTDASTLVTLTEAAPDNSQVFALGSYGLTMQIAATTGLFTGDRWTIDTVANKPQQIQTIRLGHSLPADVAYNLVSANLEVTLFIVDNIELPKQSPVVGQFNWETNTEEIRIYDDLLIEYPAWTVNGEIVSLPLMAPAEFNNPSQQFVTYRGWTAADPLITALSTTSELADLPGPIDVDNPLKYALSKALLMSAGHPIYYLNIGDPSVTDNWLRALSLAESYEGTYGLVPLTRDSTVLDLVASHVSTMSGPAFNRFRVAWFTDIPREEAVVVSSLNSDDGEPVLATITDNPDQTGSQYTLLTLATNNVNLEDLQIRPLDRVRFAFATDGWGNESYAEYVIDRVINGNTAILVSGPMLPESVAKKIEIHRTLTPGERVAAFSDTLGNLVSFVAEPGNSSGQTPGYLIRMLPFSHVYDGLTEVPSYFMAATLAAARSALAPHQAMTRLPISGFSRVKGIDDFSTTELNELAASGGFIVARDIRTGNLAVRHGVTAGNWDNVNTREESIISNAHSISFYLFDVLDPYIGQSNVTDSTMVAIATDLDAATRYLQNANFSPALGGQVIDFVVTNFRPSPVAKDTFLLQGEATVPGPTNKIVFDLLIK